MVSTVPQSSAPGIVTSNSNNNAQAMLMAAMLAQLPQNQQAPIQAALALQAQKMNNVQYMRETIRKLGPALTNGAATQAYELATPITFNLDTALNAYVEGIIVRLTVNYTLAAGTSAVYGATAGGAMALIDTVNVVYNKTQIKVYPQMLRELATIGALDQYSIPFNVGNDSGLNNYVYSGMPVSVGANSCTLEFFLPFNLIHPDDARGLLPLMAGDTGIQVIVNTPIALLGTDPQQNALYVVSGTGGAVSGVSGTLSIEAVYRDGDTYSQTDKLPFNINVLDGTFQMQIDQVLQPLIAGAVQRTKLNVMGYHYYVMLMVIDAISPAAYAADNNIVYIESDKDGIGGNTFWRYGLQTNMSYDEWLLLNRFQFKNDPSTGIVPMIAAPVTGSIDPHLRQGKSYLDNTKAGWADWRYGVEVQNVGTNGAGPRIIPCVFYINPTGLVPV
jgi:hypothetical protein